MNLKGKLIFITPYNASVTTDEDKYIYGTLQTDSEGFVKFVPNPEPKEPDDATD